MALVLLLVPGIAMAGTHVRPAAADWIVASDIDQPCDADGAGKSHSTHPDCVGTPGCTFVAVLCDDTPAQRLLTVSLKRHPWAEMAGQDVSPLLHPPRRIQL
jgi:hypothetical protein